LPGERSLQIAVRWLVKRRRVLYSDKRERGLHEENDLGKASVAAGQKSKMTQKRKLKRLVIRQTLF